MNSNTQVNEDYKFRFAYVVDLVKSIFLSSGEIENKELLARIEEVKNEQDNKHITNLEKEIEKHEVTTKRRTTRNSGKETKINSSVKENMSSIDNEVILDEEKEL